MQCRGCSAETYSHWQRAAVNKRLISTKASGETSVMQWSGRGYQTAALTGEESVSDNLGTETAGPH